VCRYSAELERVPQLHNLMQYLWSPWRMSYIQEHRKTAECVFCQAYEHADDPESLVIYTGLKTFVILNRFPYTSGHLMVVPVQHVSSLDDLDDETRTEIMELTNQSLLTLRQVYQPEGFNLGMNIGEAAGAGITEHIHQHIVPRWGGDTNFMSSLGNTRVLPEMLADTYHRVRAAWPG
jgi:ATP adenylyltransferase